MNNHRVTNLPTGKEPTDAVNWRQLSNCLTISIPVINTNLDVNNFRIKRLADKTGSSYAATVKQINKIHHRIIIFNQTIDTKVVKKRR